MMKFGVMMGEAIQYLLAAIALVIAFWAYLHATPDSVNGDGEEVAPICEEVAHD